MNFTECNPIDKKSTHCYIWEMFLDFTLLSNPDTSTGKITRLNFVVRREYQFLKNIFTEDEISISEHLKSSDLYNTMKYILNVYNFFHRQTEYSVIFVGKMELSEEYKKFINHYIVQLLITYIIRLRIQA